MHQNGQRDELQRGGKRHQEPVGERREVVHQLATVVVVERIERESQGGPQQDIEQQHGLVGEQLVAEEQNHEELEVDGYEEDSHQAGDGDGDPQMQGPFDGNGRLDAGCRSREVHIVSRD